MSQCCYALGNSQANICYDGSAAIKEHILKCGIQATNASKEHEDAIRKLKHVMMAPPASDGHEANASKEHEDANTVACRIAVKRGRIASKCLL